MKLLRNPWVVGALCAVAFGLGFYQVFQSRLRATVSARVPTALAPPERKELPLAELGTAKTSEPAESAIDQNYAQAHLSEWVESPRRDPFLAGQAAPPSGGTNVSPVSLWKLKAIWRQTGGRVAAINERTYQEGDTIQGFQDYKIERIEGDEVWLVGPRGKERLGFSKPETEARNHAGTSPSNPPAASPNRNALDARPPN